MKSNVLLLLCAVLLFAQFVLANDWHDDWPPCCGDMKCSNCWPDPEQWEKNSYEPAGRHPETGFICCPWKTTESASDVYNEGEPPRLGSHRVELIPPFIGAPPRLARAIWGAMPLRLVNENKARRHEMRKVRKAKRTAERNKILSYNMTADAAIQRLSFLGQTTEVEGLGSVYAAVVEQLKIEKPYVDAIIESLNITGAAAKQSLPEWASGVIQPNGPVDGKSVMGSDGRLLLGPDWYSNSTSASNFTSTTSLIPVQSNVLNVTLEVAIDILSHTPVQEPLTNSFHQAAENLKSNKVVESISKGPVSIDEPFKMPLFKWFKAAMGSYPWDMPVADSTDATL